MAKSDKASEDTPWIPPDSDVFSREQYYMLIRSEEKQDGMKDWNQWRDANPDVKIMLPQAPLEGRRLFGVNLQGAMLVRAELQGAVLSFGANLQGAELNWANLQGAHFDFAELQGADLRRADLRKAVLGGGTNLQGAKLGGADLRGAEILDADIRGTWFGSVIVDGETLIDAYRVDRKTDFSGVGLGNVRIQRGLRQVLEYNVRRIGWHEWYKEHPIPARAVRVFWWFSDYGFSTARILGTIGLLSTIYAMVYWIFPHLLHVEKVGKIQDFWHALYFSVVTITTLGFGDISANPYSTTGQLVLMSQVFLGYILLGALITRLAVLFSADGPALGFYKEKDEESLKGAVGGSVGVNRGQRKRRDKPAWDKE